MALNKFFLFLLPLVFSYAVQTSIAGAVVSLDSKIVVKTLTIEDFEKQIREFKIAEDPKKVIKLKYGVPELSKRNNSVINLDTPFHIVIDPPLAGDLEVFYNASQSKIKTELSKGQLMFSKKAIKSDKKVVFPRQRSEGIKLHKQSFMRIDVVISQPEGPVTYTRFFQTQPLASDNNRIYLGTFNDFEHAEWFGEWVLSRNRDVIDKYEIKVIERKEDNTLNFRVIAEATGSPTEVVEACSILQKRKYSCFVVN
tara:strand:- start:82 stop:843 length:762 start_codon:yes stop_codon:yes gene_type:complete